MLHSNGSRDLVPRPAAAAAAENVLKQNCIAYTPVYHLRSPWGGCSLGVREVAVAWAHG